MLCLSGGRHPRTGLAARRVSVIIGVSAESGPPVPAPSSGGRLGRETPGSTGAH